MVRQRTPLRKLRYVAYYERFYPLRMAGCAMEDSR
jgi:hypothetical protein